MSCATCHVELFESFMFMVAHPPQCHHVVCDLCLYKYGHYLFLQTVAYYTTKAKGRCTQRACPVKGCGASWELFLLNSLHVPMADDHCGAAWDSYIHKCIPPEFVELPICNYVIETESLHALKSQSPRALLHLVKSSWYR